jgi:hypothetical protein
LTSKELAIPIGGIDHQLEASAFLNKHASVGIACRSGISRVHSDALRKVDRWSLESVLSSFDVVDMAYTILRCVFVVLIPLISAVGSRSSVIETSDSSYYEDKAWSDTYMADWSNPDWALISGRSQQRTCVDIPANLTLCQNLGYKKMVLPNLLGHDSLGEVTQQAGSWVALQNIKCHRDTQLFLCSLFAPVCLDRLIWPCRSLCEAVKNGCVSRMNSYGFPWPNMLRCDKFPLENDLCITSRSPDGNKGKRYIYFLIFGELVSDIEVPTGCHR